MPDWHVSFTLQNCPSLHAPPSFEGEALHPVCGSHAPTVHWLLNAEQSIWLPLLHGPPWHDPWFVHGSMSSHCAPSSPTTGLHVSRSSSHTPRWHSSCDGQNFCVPPVHTPITHVSLSVQ